MLDRLRIKIFADGADIKGMKALAANPMVKGFTTNPTLMRKAGITDYVAFAHEVLTAIMDGEFSGTAYAVNPHARLVAGARSYARVSSIPGGVAGSAGGT